MTIPWRLLAVVLLALAIGACRQDPRALHDRRVANGDAYAASGKHREAIIEYRAALQAVPVDGQAYARLGREYLATGDVLNALRAIVRSAEQQPDDPRAQLLAAHTLLTAGRYRDAFRHATRTLELRPDDVDAHLVAGNALAGTGELEAARAHADRAITIDPGRATSYANLGVLAMAQGATGRAADAFARAAELDPKSATIAVALAHFYWSTGRLPEAEREFTRALRVDPDHLMANRALAAFYLATGQTARAEEPLKRTIAVNDAPGPMVMLADYYRRAGRADDAIALLERVARLDDWFAAATLRIALVRVDAGNRGAAEQAIAAVLARNRRDVRAHLALSALRAAEGRLPEAVQEARLAVDSDGRSADARLQYGSLLSRVGRLDEARRSLTTAISLRPTDVRIELALARVEAQRGDWTPVADHASAVITAWPDHGEAHLLRARALTELGNLHQARTELAAVAQPSPLNPAVQYALGRLYRQAGDPSKASAAFRRAEATTDDIAPLAELVALDLAARDVPAALSRVTPRLRTPQPSPDLLVLAARVYVAAGDATAEPLLRQALQADPSHRVATAMLGSLLLQSHRLDEARHLFEALRTREPQAPGLDTVIGLVLEQQGHGDEARAAYQRALDIDPRAGIAANNLAWQLATTGGNLDVALQLAQTAKAALPDQPEVDDTLGFVYFRKGLLDQALPHLRDSVARDATNTTARRHLAIAAAAAR